MRSTEVWLEAAALLAGRKSPPTYPEDRRIVGVTASGAGEALVADFAEQHGPAARRQWRDGAWEEPAASAIAALPTNAKIRNQIDTGSLRNWRESSRPPSSRI